MIRKVLAVICQIIAGFFVYMVALLAFFDGPDMPGIWKMAIMGGFSIPGVMAWVSGLALLRFREWKRITGIVLTSVFGFAVFGILTMICLSLTQEIKKYYPGDPMTAFGDYLTGFASLAVVGSGGILLIRRGTGREVGVIAEPEREPDA